MGIVRPERVKAAKFASEEELAARVVAWVQAQGWETFHEVQMHTYGRRADIVARCGNHLWVIETKRSLTFEVVEQAHSWHTWAHLVSIAVPEAKRDRSVMAYRFCASLGVGVIEVPTDARSLSLIRVRVPPQLERIQGKLRGPHNWLAKSLREEHKESVPGNDASKFFTPYQNTCNELRRILHEHPDGILMAQALKNIEHHYADDKSATCSLTHWIRLGKVEGMRVDVVGRRLTLFPDNKPEAPEEDDHE